MGGGSVITINSKEEWDSHTSSAKDESKAVRTFFLFLPCTGTLCSEPGLALNSPPPKMHRTLRTTSSPLRQVIVDFSATWCGERPSGLCVLARSGFTLLESQLPPYFLRAHTGPCRAISPYFGELSTAYPSVVFLGVDVDAVEVSKG